MMTEKDLLAKKKEIEKTKESLAQLKGQEKVLVKQLKENWNCDTLQDAKKLIQELETNVKSLNEQIEDKLKQLENLI